MLERFETEMTVIGPMGFSSYFLVVADICKYARDNKRAGRTGPWLGDRLDRRLPTRITELDPLEHGLLFERFLNPERINPPDVDLDFDDRQRDQMVRYVTEKYGDGVHRQVNTFGKHQGQGRDQGREPDPRLPLRHGERITKAMPPDVMGKSIPIDGMFDPERQAVQRSRRDPRAVRERTGRQEGRRQRPRAWRA